MSSITTNSMSPEVPPALRRIQFSTIKQEMLFELWQRLRGRSRRGFQLLPSTVSEFEFANMENRLNDKKSRIRYYSQYDGFENPLKEKQSEETVELRDVSQNSMSTERTIFLGFISAENSSNDANKDEFSSTAYSEFKKEHNCMDRALAECNRIRQKPGLIQGILLKSLEPNPMFSFLHYALFDSNQASDRTNNIFADDPALSESNSLFGFYEELYSIRKSSTFIEPSTLPTQRHTGFIVSNFKIMDRSRRQQLEKNWLYWSAANDIYRYSPRNWNLRKISLLRAKASDSSKSFAYILMCEYGQILHPANFVQAMDMCERLRGRVCGNFNLYRVAYNYYEAEKSTTTDTFRQTENLGSPRQSMSNSSSMVRPMQRLASPLRISRMGVSQDVEDGTSTRKTSLYRMRDRSLGYETRFNSYHMFEELT